MNSTASSARTIPPIPTTGIPTACAASYTIRTAIGRIAGPDNPPVKFAIRTRRVSTSIASATNVFTSEIACTPASATTFAISLISVTFGDSFTISGRPAASAASRHRRDSRYSASGSVPNTIPPWLVFGQLAFSSYIATPSASFSTWITSTQSSIV